VFFYQSPHGSRVFFDDLGPPWPKHPCTDNSLNFAHGPANTSPTSAPSTYRHATSARNDGAHSPSVYAWQSHGWSPFLTKPVLHSANWVRLNGVVATTGKRLVLYAPSSQITLLSAPMLVRFVAGRYMLSSFKHDHLGRIAPVEVATEDSLPEAKAWGEYGDLARLLLWFFSAPALPVAAFDLRKKGQRGLSLWISDPPRFYIGLNQIIELGPDKTTREQHRGLYENLSALHACFGGK